MSSDRKKHTVQEFLVTGFFTGYLPIIPGTFGTLIGVLIYVLLSPYSLVYYIVLVVFVLLSVKLSEYAVKHIFKNKRSPHIVIDEMTGFMVAMISFPFIKGDLDSIRYLAFGFILFRLFDIWKPVNSLKLKGGVGIVLNDLMAGVFTNLFLQFLRFSPHLQLF